MFFSIMAYHRIWNIVPYAIQWGFLGGTVVKNPPAIAGDTRDAGSIPGSGRSPREGNGNPFQYSCLENSMDRRVWQATVHEAAKNQTWLSDWAPLGERRLEWREGVAVLQQQAGKTDSTEKMSLSTHLQVERERLKKKKKVTEWALLVLRGQVFQAVGMARAKALRITWLGVVKK